MSKYSDEQLINAYRYLENRKNQLEKKASEYGTEVKDKKVLSEQEQLKKEIEAYTIACECIVEAGKK